MQDGPQPRKSDPPQSRALLVLLVSMVLLAFGPWFVRMADVGPVAAGFWRQLLALPFLIPLMAWSGQRVPQGRGMIVGLGICGLLFAADLAAWHAGIVHTKLANATLFGNIASFVFPLYGFVVARAWPGRNASVALILAGAGVMLLMGRSYELSPRNLVGDLLCILAGLFYTGYLIGLDRLRGRLEPWPVLVVVTLFSAPALLLAAHLFGERVTPGDWTPLVLLALASQVLGQGCIIYAMARLPPLIVGLGLLVQPIVGAAIGWIAYGERLGALDFVGAVMIGAALVLVRRQDRPKPEVGTADATGY